MASESITPPPPEPAADDAITREQRRSRRAREVRARVVNLERETKRERELLRLVYPDTNHWRPATRGECVDGVRPCPYVGCQYHLYLDVAAGPNLKLNFPDLEPDELIESCALDVAEDGGRTLEDVARLTNLTRERVRQVEVRALVKLQKAHLAEHADGERRRVRVLEDFDLSEEADDDGED